ncbi:hypothetical protein ACP0HM_23120 [Escherichia coli]
MPEWKCFTSALTRTISRSFTLKVTTFTHLSQLPELWKARGWDITA